MLNMIIKMMSCNIVLLACVQVQAMQPLEENLLGDITAQDGLTLNFNTDVSIDSVVWTDHDGLQPINGQNFSILTPSKGALIMGDTQPIKIYGGNTNITIDADAGNGQPFLNLEIELPEYLTIETGDIYVASRDANTNAVQTKTKLLNNMTILLHGMNMNIQLGNSPQGELAKVYGTVDNGIRVQNIGVLNDNGSNIMSMSEFKVTDYGNPNQFTFNGTGVSILTQGIIIRPSLGKKLDVSMNNFRFGDNTSLSMGEMFISGMEVGNNIVQISGH